MNEFLQKILLNLPAPKDFIMPSRFPRKKSMITGYLYLGVIILGIICLCSNRWAVVDSTSKIDLGAKGFAEVTTTGYYNLRSFELNSVTELNGKKIYSKDNGSIMLIPDNKNLGSCSRFVFVYLIIVVVLSVPQIIITFYHGWARLNPKVTYIITCSVAFIFAMFLAVCFAAYVACKPKKGCNLGWGCWLLFVLTIYQCVLLALHLLDKPNGFVRYESGELVKDEPKPLKRRSTGGITPTKPIDKTAEKRPAPPVPSRGNGGAKPKLPSRPGEAGGRRRLVALHDCEAEQEGDLAFRKGDIIYFVSKEPGEGWITGEINGVRGIFPENYVQDA